jgi:hypothetical protein
LFYERQKHNENRLPSSISALYTQKHLQSSTKRSDVIAQTHSVQVTAERNVGCAYQLRSRKFAYFELNSPAGDKAPPSSLYISPPPHASHLSSSLTRF